MSDNTDGPTGEEDDFEECWGCGEYGEDCRCCMQCGDADCWGPECMICGECDCEGCPDDE